MFEAYTGRRRPMKILCLNFSNNDHVEVKSAYTGKEVKKKFYEMKSLLEGDGDVVTYLDVLDELEELGYIHSISTACDEYVEIEL